MDDFRIGSLGLDGFLDSHVDRTSDEPRKRHKREVPDADEEPTDEVTLHSADGSEQEDEPPGYLPTDHGAAGKTD